MRRLFQPRTTLPGGFNFTKEHIISFPSCFVSCWLATTTTTTTTTTTPTSILSPSSYHPRWHTLLFLGGIFCGKTIRITGSTMGYALLSLILSLSRSIMPPPSKPPMTTLIPAMPLLLWVTQPPWFLPTVIVNRQPFYRVTCIFVTLASIVPTMMGEDCGKCLCIYTEISFSGRFIQTSLLDHHRLMPCTGTIPII